MNRSATRRGRAGTYWIYGTHAVRAALANPDRRVIRLMLAERAARDFLPSSQMPKAEFAAPGQIAAVLEPGASHGGVAAEVVPLEGGQPALSRLLELPETTLLLLLDQVTDPRNVGAILRSASVFGASAVLAPARGAPRETGALAKAASGALDRVPYLRIGNLAGAIARLDNLGWSVIGLHDSSPEDIDSVASAYQNEPTALVLGAEGRGLRRLTRARCHRLARIPGRAGMPNLNVSAAAAIALFAFTRTAGRTREYSLPGRPPHAR